MGDWVLHSGSIMTAVPVADSRVIFDWPMSDVSMSRPTIAFAPISFAFCIALSNACFLAFSISDVKALTSPPLSA